MNARIRKKFFFQKTQLKICNSLTDTVVHEVEFAVTDKIDIEQRAKTKPIAIFWRFLSIKTSMADSKQVIFRANPI